MSFCVFEGVSTVFSHSCAERARGWLGWVLKGGCQPLGFQLGEDADAARAEHVKELVTAELKRYFKPEFLNRVDETVVFQVTTRVS